MMKIFIPVDDGDSFDNSNNDNDWWGCDKMTMVCVTCVSTQEGNVIVRIGSTAHQKAKPDMESPALESAQKMEQATGKTFCHFFSMTQMQRPWEKNARDAGP